MLRPRSETESYAWILPQCRADPVWHPTEFVVALAFFPAPAHTGEERDGTAEGDKLAHRISRFAAAFATLLGTSLIPASAEPAHNYVFPDMTWHKLEPPPPGRSPPDVVLVDTESAKKFGDTVQFDELLLKNG